MVPSEKYKSKLEWDLIIFQPEYQIITYAGKDVDKMESYTPLVEHKLVYSLWWRVEKFLLSQNWVNNMTETHHSLVFYLKG